MDGKHTPVECLDRVCNMILRSDDVIILGYPKSGENNENNYQQIKIA